MRCDYCGKELSAALQERDRLLEALRKADVECRYCAYSKPNPDNNCADKCYECSHPCLCYTCNDRDHWKWNGFDDRTTATRPFAKFRKIARTDELEIQRAVGIIEGVIYGLDEVSQIALSTAVDMIDEVFRK